MRTGGGCYRRVASFDDRVDAGGFGVRGKDGVDKGVEVSVGLNVGRDEEVGFVGHMGEDEGGGDFGVASWSERVSRHRWSMELGRLRIPDANSKDGSCLMRLPSAEGPTAKVPGAPAIFRAVFALSRVAASAARRHATPCPAHPAKAVKFWKVCSSVPLRSNAN